MKLNNNEVILFQGDSITDGNRNKNQDPYNLMGHGYQFVVGAKLQLDNLDKNINIVNRAVSGNRISDLYGRWIEDTIKINPTILSILVGVNDVGFSCDWDCELSLRRYERIYRLMLDEAIEHNKNLKIVIMEPFVGKAFENEERKSFFHKNIKAYQRTVNCLAKKYNAVFVPLQRLFDEYQNKIEPEKLIYDGVHPTGMGHMLIAQQWLSCVIG